LNNCKTRKLEIRIKKLSEIYNDLKSSVMKRAKAVVSLDMAIGGVANIFDKIHVKLIITKNKSHKGYIRVVLIFCNSF